MRRGGLKNSAKGPQMATIASPNPLRAVVSLWASGSPTIDAGQHCRPTRRRRRRDRRSPNRHVPPEPRPARPPPPSRSASHIEHARANAELARLPELDPIGIDNDVEGRAGDADGLPDRGLINTRRRILKREIGDRGHHQQVREKPATTRAPRWPSSGRRTPSTHPRPRETLDCTRSEREGVTVDLVNAVLRPPGVLRRAIIA